MRLRTILWAASIVLLIASTSRAQQGYCDITQPNSGAVTVGVPVTLSVCSPTTDQSTPPNPVTPITGWAIYINGTKTTPVFTAGATSVNGQTVWTMAATSPTTPGIYTYEAAAIDNKGREGLKSSPFALTAKAVDTAPAKATNLTVK